MDLPAYLQSLRSSLARVGSATPLCVVAGNESCDLDSIASAIVYAHYESIKRPPDQIVLPLLQCLRKDLNMSQETCMVLNKMGVNLSDLVYIDDLSPDMLSAVAELSLVLVDHNFPTGMLESFSSRVVRVIDHHKQSVDSVASKPGVTTTLQMVGSCASLVACELLENDRYVFEEPAALLLLSAILLDTGNLKAPNRVTPVDEDAVEKLVPHLSSSFNRDDYFSQLLLARFDTSKLTTTQALQKDYKECCVNNYSIGFCSITTLLSEFLVRANMNDLLNEFFSSHKLNALVILGISITDPISMTAQRQIAVFQSDSANSEFAESILNVLEADEELHCKRADSQVPQFSGVLLEQGNTEMSRKHILPIISSFVMSVESEYPRTGLSPSPIMLEEAGQSTSATADEPFPLEPTITILSTASVKESKSDKISRESSSNPKPIPEYSSAEEFKERRSHLLVSVGGEENVISLDMVEPYKKIIQHAGYIGESRQALVVISACYLPPRSLPNYNHVIHHTFYYILSVLDKLIVDNYTIVYLHSGAPRNSMPSLPLLHKLYRTIDRRLRKQLTQLYIVHPTFWVKTMLRLARPFISTKFWRKVHFIPTLQDLADHVKLDEDYISAPVVAVDKLVMSRIHSSQKYKTTAATEAPQEQ